MSQSLEIEVGMLCKNLIISINFQKVQNFYIYFDIGILIITVLKHLPQRLFDRSNPSTNLISQFQIQPIFNKTKLSKCDSTCLRVLKTHSNRNSFSCYEVIKKLLTKNFFTIWRILSIWIFKVQDWQYRLGTNFRIAKIIFQSHASGKLVCLMLPISFIILLDFAKVLLVLLKCFLRWCAIDALRLTWQYFNVTWQNLHSAQ